MSSISAASAFSSAKVSEEFEPVPGGLFTFNHELGKAPKGVIFLAVCKIADAGYQPGDTFFVPSAASNVDVLAREVDENKLVVSMYSNQPYWRSKTGLMGQISSTNWRLKALVWS